MKKEDNIPPVIRSLHPRPTPPMLVNEISRLFGARMRTYDIEGVMTQDSARLIMRALLHKDGCSQLELVRQTHLTPPTVSVTLRRMESEGLVLRRQNELDQRAVCVFLTEKGKAHNEEIRKRLQALDAELMRDFSAEEIELLRKMLERMRDNILPEQLKNNS